MRSSLLLLFLLLPAVASTQTLLVGFGGNPTTLINNVVTLGKGTCGDTVNVTWTVSSNVCSPGLTIYLVNAELPCSETVPATAALRKNVGETVVNAAPPPSGAGTGHSGSFDTTLTELFGAAQACGSADPQTRTFRVCGFTKVIDALGVCNTNNAATLSSPENVEVVYDTVPPTAPAVSVRAQDQKLIVTIPTSDDIATATVKVKGPSDADFRTVATKNPVQSFEITGLVNGQTYLVKANQTDLAGNVSDDSGEVEGIPVAVTDFRERYLDAGGSEQGGCGAAGGAGLSAGAALAVLGLWLASRRRAS